MTDQPASTADARAADLERRIEQLERRSPSRMMQEGRSGAEEAFWAVMHSIFPDEARKHMKAAGREQLLAARVYLDRWIARLDQPDAQPDAGREHHKIEIE
jgi:hypothetical protein